MRLRWAMAALLFIGLAVVTPAFAKKHAFPNGQGLTVTSVDTVNSKISFKLQDNKQTLTYNLPLGTVITINREPATLNQIKPGMSVLSYTEGDGQDLSQIDVGGKKRK